MANIGDDEATRMEVIDDDDANTEVRTIRIVDPTTEDDLSRETLAMEENDGQAGARGRDRTNGRDRNNRGRGRGGRGMARRGGWGRYMDN